MSHRTNSRVAASTLRQKLRISYLLRFWLSALIISFWVAAGSFAYVIYRLITDWPK